MYVLKCTKGFVLLTWKRRAGNHLLHVEYRYSAVNSYSGNWLQCSWETTRHYDLYVCLQAFYLRKQLLSMSTRYTKESNVQNSEFLWNSCTCVLGCRQGVPRIVEIMRSYVSGTCALKECIGSPYNLCEIRPYGWMDGGQKVIWRIYRRMLRQRAEWSEGVASKRQRIFSSLANQFRNQN